MVWHLVLGVASVLDVEEQFEEDDDDAHEENGVSHHVESGILAGQVLETVDPQEVRAEEDH